MYCLTFTEIGLHSTNFFYHSFIKAVEMQRTLLINEINNMISIDTDIEPFKFHNLLPDVSNHDLIEILEILNKLKNRDEWTHHIINIEINDILFEDKLFDDESISSC